MSGMPEFESEYSPAYRRINVAGMFGGVMAGGLEAIVYSEERRVAKVLQSQPINPTRMSIKRTIDAELLIDPLQMVAIHKWLGEKIAEYEKLFGRIPSPEELESRVKRKPEGA